MSVTYPDDGQPPIVPGPQGAVRPPTWRGSAGVPEPPPPLDPTQAYPIVTAPGITKQRADRGRNQLLGGGLAAALAALCCAGTVAIGLTSGDEPDIGPAASVAPSSSTGATTAGVIATRPAATRSSATAKPKRTTTVKKPAAKPKPNPKRTTTRPDEPVPDDVFYANCAAVRAAGAAPIRRGDPGYSRKLDRDGDGIACER